MDWIWYVNVFCYDLKFRDKKNISQDWEFPGSRDRDASSDSKVKFNILIHELREAFDDEIIRINKTNRLLLTAAVAADPKKIDQGYVIQELCK